MAMMTAEEAAERGKDLSFEKVWTMFAETDRKMAEARAEIERFLKEQFAQNERKVAEAERKAAEARVEAERGGWADLETKPGKKYGEKGSCQEDGQVPAA